LANLVSIAKLACTRDRRTLFHGLDFDVAKGGCVELRGPNGSGKSTLLRCIAGLYVEYEGRIDTAPYAWVGHRPGVGQLLTPRENLAWYARLGDLPKAPDEQVAAALDRLGIASIGDVACAHLSAGQLRRAALARLLIADRPVWLLDEPLTALDAAGVQLVARLVTDHCEAGGAVLAATHAPLGVAGARVLELG
jgi:heme exporter protein A